MKRSFSLLLAWFTLLPTIAPAAPWQDVTEASGLGQNAVSRLKFADLDGNGFADAIFLPSGSDPMPPRVLLHTGAIDSNGLPGFEELAHSGLPSLARHDLLAFADLDNDGRVDALVARFLDVYHPDYQPPADPPSRTAWLPGRGDGTFGEPVLLPEARLATTHSVAVGDVNQDGLPDLFLGNGYEAYGRGYEAFGNDLLLQYRGPGCEPAFVRWPLPEETAITDYRDDLGGRPSYGVALPRLDAGLPMLLEMSYGRRWNRLYRMVHRDLLSPPGRSEFVEPGWLPQDPRARGAHLVRHLQGRDIAPLAGVDGDAIRHGRHPRWPDSHASARPRSQRSDEAPFRSNGNTFDSAIGDIDNDGDFDLFLSTIIHAWAGESSDKSRFLVNQLEETGTLRFLNFEHLSVDRIPALPDPGQPLDPVHTRYNQGDIFAELADLNHDGRLDLILCSSDYPDPPPHDERLRIYFQQHDGRFRDVTAELGIDQVGAGMPSLADVDGDGDLDLLVGQSFNRLTPEQRRAAALASGALPADAPEEARPQLRARLFLNHSPESRKSLMLDLVGDPAAGTAREAYGAIVRLHADLDNDPETPDVVQSRQVLGPGGHAGKQHALTLHFGLGQAGEASRVEILWPGREDQPQVLQQVAAGRYTVAQGSDNAVPVRIPR